MTSQTEQKAQRVHIEFQRVQTWLFAVPRLKAMVGANAMLGTVLRESLPKLAKTPDKAWKLQGCPDSGSYGKKADDDPLQAEDDPATDAKAGILARDGGHFEADFASGAEEFAKEASALLERKLPGLRFSVAVNKQRIERNGASLSYELPVLAPCEWSGRGLAESALRHAEEAKRSRPTDHKPELARARAELRIGLLTADVTQQRRALSALHALWRKDRGRALWAHDFLEAAVQHLRVHPATADVRKQAQEVLRHLDENQQLSDDVHVARWRNEVSALVRARDGVLTQ